MKTTKLLKTILFSSTLSSCGVLWDATMGSDAKIKSAEYTPSRTQAVHLIRQHQRVLRYDCYHNLTSDKVEEVRTANALITLEPSVKDPKAYRSEFYNQRTKSPDKFGWGTSTFYVDISEKAALAMGVDPGENVIEYRFYECLDWGYDKNANKVCTSERLFDQGTWSLDITYTEETLEGSQDIIASCQ